MRYTTRNIRFSISSTNMSSLVQQLEREESWELVSLIPTAFVPAEMEQTSGISYANELPKGSYVIRDFIAVFKERR